MNGHGDLRDGDVVAEVEGACFHHQAVFYAGDDEFLAGTLPFITDAVVAEEPVLVVVSEAKVELLREALGGDATPVRFADMHVLGRNPARIIPAWHQFLEENAPDRRPVRGVGEPIWPGRSEAELAECERHEALLNLAFDGGQAWRLLCPYDLYGLEAKVIEAARRNHPFIADHGGSRASESYLCSDEACGPFEGALPPAPREASEIAFEREHLRMLRSSLAVWAAGELLCAERVEQLVLAVSELASNSVRYGGGRGTLRMWSEGERLLCEVFDGGHIEQPLAGRIRPTTDQHTGRGLWLVNHLCDLVQIRTGPSGNVVRVQIARDEQVGA